MGSDGASDDGWQWRAPTRADVPAWMEAVAAVEAVDRTGEALTEEDLADQLDLSYFDPEHDGRLIWSPDGEVVAYGTVENRPSDLRRRVSLDGAVRPEWRRRGIGHALAQWQIDRGIEVADAADRALPGWLEFAADERDDDRAALFTKLGFAPHRYYLEMRRPLAAPIPEPIVPDGLALVPFALGMEESTRQAHNEAFRDHWGSSPIDDETWMTWVTGHRDFRADLSFVVREIATAEVAGYAINAAHPNDWPALGFTEAWTHQLGVRRPWRGRGVARALLAASIRAFANDGLEFAALDVDAENPTGALALYQGMGYARDRCRVAWARHLDEIEAPT